MPTNRMQVLCRVMASITLLLSTTVVGVAADGAEPIVDSTVVFEEVDGVLAIEAEHFHRQSKAGKRAWHVTSTTLRPAVEPDGDSPHVARASGGAYVEALPDTRRTHDDKLVAGENFSNEPGRMAVLHYRVHFNTPGRYHVWARTWSTGTEDNGLHFGLDDEWPESGRRWQTVRKHGWSWECKQRTQKVHTGVPFQLFLDVEEPGDHELTMAMREDGAEVDRIVLTREREQGRPEGLGPEAHVKSGELPKPFPFVKAKPQPPRETASAPRRPLEQPRRPDGDGSVEIGGDLMQWHAVTLSVDGPFAHERDTRPNPFTDHRLEVVFRHESGTPEYRVPGYFAADGAAANTGAESGTVWRAHLSPDKPGRWDYEAHFTRGANEAFAAKAGGEVCPGNGTKGSFEVKPTDKTGRDFRARGRLEYVGGHYLKFAGTGEPFLKVGPDAPETLLGYSDFDGTIASKNKKNVPLKTWRPHVRDWRTGDPTWGDGRGKGLIGALNYLAESGCNTFSFLPYNAGGDGDNVWPFVARNEKRHYDCSKLDQWRIVFDHATNRGLHLHFKLQENEMDDDRRGHDAKQGRVPESLDGGKLGIERKLYCRELIARFGHELALNWNIGEENTQSAAEQRDMIAYLHETDPYDHNIVIHTFPNQQDKVYSALLGNKSLLTGASLQNGWNAAHQRTLKWVRESARAGRPWVVCNDEQNPASHGVPPDPGYERHDGFAVQGGKKYSMHDIRKECLWGTLMAGGAGVEYYFGYKLPQNDLVCQDFRSRDQSWRYGRIAIDFFREQKIPVEAMRNADELVGNAKHSNDRYCFAEPGELYLVYQPSGGSVQLDLSDAGGREFSVSWFDPRNGGALVEGSVAKVTGGGEVDLGSPPRDANEDWLAVVR